MADLTLKELLDATDAVLGDDGGKHRLDDKARAVVLERDRLRNLVVESSEVLGAIISLGVLNMVNPGSTKPRAVALLSKLYEEDCT